MGQKRTDEHRPSLLDPAEYSFLGCFYQGSSDAMAKSYMYDEQELEKNIEAAGCTEFQGNHVNKITCDHCGASFAHGVCFLHKPTNTYISVGHICAADTIGLPSRAAAVKRSAEKAAAEEKARQVRIEANKGWRDANADVIEFLAKTEAADVEWRAANEQGNDEYEAAVSDHYTKGTPLPRKPYTKLRAPHSFLLDMVGTLNKWGALSPKQTDATRKFMAAAEKFAAEPESEPEPEPTTPLVEGRRVITGTVLHTKWQESDYGGNLKMLVQEADYNKVWGTVPAILQSIQVRDADGEYCGSRAVEKGDKITFTAEVARSRDDEHFGFYKRPTSARLMEAQNA